MATECSDSDDDLAPSPAQLQRHNLGLTALNQLTDSADAPAASASPQSPDAIDRENQASETQANESDSQDRVRPASPNSVQVPKVPDAEAPAQESCVKAIPPLSLELAALSPFSAPVPPIVEEAPPASDQTGVCSKGVDCPTSPKSESALYSPAQEHCVPTLAPSADAPDKRSEINGKGVAALLSWSEQDKAKTFHAGRLDASGGVAAPMLAGANAASPLRNTAAGAAAGAPSWQRILEERTGAASAPGPKDGNGADTSASAERDPFASDSQSPTSSLKATEKPAPPSQTPQLSVDTVMGEVSVPVLTGEAAISGAREGGHAAVVADGGAGAARLISKRDPVWARETSSEVREDRCEGIEDLGLRDRRSSLNRVQTEMSLLQAEEEREQGTGRSLADLTARLYTSSAFSFDRAPCGGCSSFSCHLAICCLGHAGDSRFCVVRTGCVC